MLLQYNGTQFNRSYDEMFELKYISKSTIVLLNAVANVQSSEMSIIIGTLFNNKYINLLIWSKSDWCCQRLDRRQHCSICGSRWSVSEADTYYFGFTTSRNLRLEPEIGPYSKARCLQAASLRRRSGRRCVRSCASPSVTAARGCSLAHLWSNTFRQ